jgi:hypothetical protein
MNAKRLEAFSEIPCEFWKFGLLIEFNDMVMMDVSLEHILLFLTPFSARNETSGATLRVD